MPLLTVVLAAVLAGATPAASPSPAASPAPRFRLSGDAYSVFIDSATSGPGTTPPQGPAFANGSALAPNSPYDLFSSAPLTPGVAGILQLNLTGKYTGARYNASAVIGAGLVTGSVQNAIYWGENLIGPLNPHINSGALPYAIAFPTHAGQDDVTGARIAPLFAGFGSHDGSWQIRGGYFDLNQSDRFVFVQPPLTNVSPAIGMQTPESLGNGSPTLEIWPNAPPGLPLHGIDFTGRRGDASLELTTASLPALPGEGARATIGSLVIDHGDGTRYSFSYMHAATGGVPFLSTTFYGADPHATPGPEGNLQTSFLSGQQETIAGARAAVHAFRAVDGVVEIGRTWYDAQDVFRPGSNKPGGFYHLGLSHGWKDAELHLDAYRFEARYANIILPYAIPENVWSAAWAWPGVWLKSTYQLVDNIEAPGSNRQGYRLGYSRHAGPFEFHVAYALFHQIDPATYANMQQAGFVDGFYLPQQNAVATLGMQQQYNAWLAWHARFGDLTLEFTNDELHRDAAPSHYEDAVAYQAPQLVFTYAHRFSQAAVADAGFARYAMNGTWAQPFTNVQYFQNIAFAGAQIAESPHMALLVHLRYSHFAGLPTEIGTLSPDFAGTVLVVEQRVHL
jgi:hypothetical protein